MVFIVCSPTDYSPTDFHTALILVQRIPAQRIFTRHSLDVVQRIAEHRAFHMASMEFQAGGGG